MTKLQKPRFLFTILFPMATLLVLAGCIGAAPAPVSNACASVLGQIIHPSPGFETRWTAQEQRQVLDHNNASRAQCPG